MAIALREQFPKIRLAIINVDTSVWETRMALRAIPNCLQALADLHPALKKLMVFKCWQSHASQNKQARQAKQRKKERRQHEIDEQLAQAVHKSKQDGSHSLYKVIRRFRACKPQERVQLRDS